MAVPRGIVAAAQIAGFVCGMLGVPCLEYGVVGRLQAALLRQLAAVAGYAVVLLAFVALLADLQSGGLQPADASLGEAGTVLAWLGAIAILVSYVLAYAAPRLDPRATLRLLGGGIAVGAALIGVCTFVFLWRGGAAPLAAAGAGLMVAASFLSAGFAFLVVPLVAPRSGGRGAQELGVVALLLGLALAFLPRILFLLNVSTR